MSAPESVGGLDTRGALSGFVEVWHTHRALILAAAALGLLYVWFKLPSSPSSEFPKKTPVVESQEIPPEKPAPSPAPKPDSDAPPSSGPRRIKGELRRSSPKPESQQRQIQVLVFFSSLTTTTHKTAEDFTNSLHDSLQARDCASSFRKPQLLDLTEIDYDEYFISPPKSSQGEDADSDGTHCGPVDFFYLVLVPSYNIDTINDNFLQHLSETHHDFRIDTAPLSSLLGYSVFGFGDREGWPTEAEGFCFQAKEVDRWLAKLTARKRAYPLGICDPKRDIEERLSEWSEGINEVLGFIARTGSLGEGVRGSGDADESDVEEDASEGEQDDGEVIIEAPVKTKKPVKKAKKDVDDLEDLGRIMKASRDNAQEDEEPESTPSAPIAIDFTTYKTPKSSKRPQQPIKEMVPKASPTYNSLTKQGYSIVGSHSGVKICRWTKSALRGRGSCYKFSFYGINSHQCMETTPSLSCSNKCVFCWRHGTNPVGTTWRWVVDPPDLIFDGVKAGHYQKIKMMRGVPGVRAERFAEAMRIRHCALSLVGEPIFYPHINEFLGMLHRERISSFLVCNAQHPDQLAALKAVTQLYVSIDASNRESLRRIDRPLHRDFWERFQRCLDILREVRHKQRTVFRLTLVKGFNVDDEVEGYADLVERALPCFVEVKGVTYCGTASSAGAGLSMTNVPFYAEVSEFVTALERRLRERGLAYGIAAEHAHSCCVLLASDRFRCDDDADADADANAVGSEAEGKPRRPRYRTRIDYTRFFELLEERGADGQWAPEDYAGEPTPEWAVWGAGGFDPRDQRVDRKGRAIEV